MNNLMNAIEAYIDARIKLEKMRAYEKTSEHAAYTNAQKASYAARKKLVDEIVNMHLNPSTVYLKDRTQK